MTVRTKAELATQVSTLLADNATGAISESDIREVFTDLIDSTVSEVAVIYYGSGGFVPAADGTFPGYNTGGLSYDKATEEKAALPLLVPAAWNTCTVNLLCITPAASGDVKLTFWPFGVSPIVTVFTTGAAFTINRIPIGVGLAIGAGPFYDIAGSTKAFTTGSLVRNGGDVLDTLDDDLIVLFVELVKVT